MSELPGALLARGIGMGRWIVACVGEDACLSIRVAPRDAADDAGQHVSVDDGRWAAVADSDCVAWRPL